MITLGLRETDNNNRMITITGFPYSNVDQMGPRQSDQNMWLITLTVIILRGFHCISYKQAQYIELIVFKHKYQKLTIFVPAI